MNRDALQFCLLPLQDARRDTSPNPGPFTGMERMQCVGEKMPCAQASQTGVAPPSASAHSSWKLRTRRPAERQAGKSKSEGSARQTCQDNAAGDSTFAPCSERLEDRHTAHAWLALHLQRPCKVATHIQCSDWLVLRWMLLGRHLAGSSPALAAQRAGSAISKVQRSKRPRDAAEVRCNYYPAMKCADLNGEDICLY